MEKASFLSHLLQHWSTLTLVPENCLLFLDLLPSLSPAEIHRYVQSSKTRASFENVSRVISDLGPMLFELRSVGRGRLIYRKCPGQGPPLVIWAVELESIEFTGVIQLAKLSTAVHFYYVHQCQGEWNSLYTIVPLIWSGLFEKKFVV